MELTLLFDHRFYKNGTGTIFSLKSYNYDLLSKRYLTVFDRLRIVARICEDEKIQAEGRETEGPGVEVVSLGNWLGASGLFFKYPQVKMKLKKEVQKKNAFIMIAPGNMGVMAYTHLRKLDTPYGIEVVGDPYDSFSKSAFTHPFRPLIRRWSTATLRKQCNRAVAAAYVTESALQNRYPPHNQAFSTHYSSIELTEDAFKVDDKLIKQKESTFIITNVGTMAQLYKAQDDLIKAVGLCIQNGFDIKLNLIGDGAYRKELEKVAKESGIRDRVTFFGNLPSGKKIRDQLDISDLFVMPSRQEGVPRAMIEAMARKLPCIGTNIGGIPELLCADNLVSVDDYISLAAKIGEVLNDRDRRMKMSSRNYDIAFKYSANLLQKRRELMYSHLKEITKQAYDK